MRKPSDEPEAARLACRGASRGFSLPGSARWVGRRGGCVASSRAPASFSVGTAALPRDRTDEPSLAATVRRFSPRSVEGRSRKGNPASTEARFSAMVVVVGDGSRPTAAVMRHRSPRGEGKAEARRHHRLLSPSPLLQLPVEEQGHLRRMNFRVSPPTHDLTNCFMSRWSPARHESHLRFHWKYFKSRTQSTKVIGSTLSFSEN